MALREDVRRLVDSIPLADTHEHIMEEKNRLQPGDGPRLDDFAVLFVHYASADLLSAGMPPEDLEKFFTRGIDAREKWRLLKPYYKAARNTGYLQAVRASISELYGVDDLTDATVLTVDERLRGAIAPGFTRRILRETARVDHCQVNSLEYQPFCETSLPDLLLQDIAGPTLVAEWKNRSLWELAGIEVRTLYDYHRVLDHVYERFGRQAVALKNQMNYQRRLDFAEVDAQTAAPLFEKDLTDANGLSPVERKAVEDHLFHYCVRKAAEHGLPVKLHAGYYSGNNWMPLDRLVYNGGDLCRLLAIHPDVSFVIMHINYPYQHELTAICKHYANACADMCWAWIIDPASAVRFVKEFLTAVPASKLLAFGGDYMAVENVVGHAVLARRGISQALCELAEEGWLSESDIEYVANRIMCDNARELFRVEERFGLKKFEPAAGSD